MLTAQELMNKDVITVTGETPVRELARILSENKIGGVPVLNDQGGVIGVVTESDLIDQNKKVHIPTVVAILDSFLFLESPEKMEKELKKWLVQRFQISLPMKSSRFSRTHRWTRSPP